MTMQPDDCLIWSNEHCGWWRAGECGYTQKIWEAGRYSHARAIAICAQASIGSKPGETLNELPVRCDDVRAMMEAAYPLMRAERKA